MSAAIRDQLAVLSALVQSADRAVQNRLVYELDRLDALRMMHLEIERMSKVPVDGARVVFNYTLMLSQAISDADRARDDKRDNEALVARVLIGTLLPFVRDDYARALRLRHEGQL